MFRIKRIFGSLCMLSFACTHVSYAADTTQTKLLDQPSLNVSKSLVGDRGLLTGYGTATFSQTESQHSLFSSSFNPIFLFRFNDLLLWESEVEFTINDNGDTDTKLEYASIDWFIHDNAIFIAGKFLTPLGFFIRNLHPSWINELPSKPIGFDDDQAIPPESEVGAQLEGSLPITDKTSVNYALFIANGPQANVSDTAVTSVQTDGQNTTTKLFGGRLGFLPIPEIEIGVSAATGRVSFQNSTGDIVQTSSPYHVLGADANFHFDAWKIRGEYIQQQIPSNANNTSGVTQGGKWSAYYGQLAYRFSSPWEIILRYGFFNSPQPDETQHQTTFGLDYWLMESAVAKLAYEINSGQAGSTANNNTLLLQLAYGF